MTFFTRISLLSSLLIISLCSILFSLSKGSVNNTLLQFFSAISSQSELHDIIFNLRLPRTISAFVTGGLLALSGCLMQVLLRNPLADPYVLGVSGGAAVMMLLTSLAGLSGYWLSGSAWLGSLTAMCLTLFLTRKKFTHEHLLLTGVALASGFSALIGLILLASPARMIHSLLFWLLGDLSVTELPVLAGTILLLGIIFTLPLTSEMNLLARGDEAAKALGVNTHRLRLKLYLLSSLLTASAVAMAGCIGFVGLIVPHLLRLSGCYDQRILLPAAILLGGSLLTCADTLGRTVFSPAQIPVGIMTAVIGIPIFLVVLRK